MKLKNLRKTIRNDFNIVHSIGRQLSASRNSDEFLAAELIRNTHSMEKGLSIPNPKLGYGHAKQEEMLDCILKLKDSQNIFAVEAIKMAVDSLRKYLDYHDANNYSDKMIEKIRGVLKEYPNTNSGVYGGTVTLNKDTLKFDIPAIEEFIRARHSIRDFSEDDVSDENLLKALELAQRAPSACNRQGYRVYVLGQEQSKEYAKQLKGIGGFADSVNRFIMITGKLSTYKKEEINQYIVSASMYAAYLTLTLHLYGMGACVVQRPLIYNKNWEQLREKYNIPNDEQLICLLATGNLKEEMQVPLSHRLSKDIMFHFIGE